MTLQSLFQGRGQQRCVRKFGEMAQERTWIRSQRGEKRQKTKREQQSSWASNL